MGRITQAQYQKLLQRDSFCPHCGSDGGELIVHHRLNRGMGGKNNLADTPSNLMILCSLANGLIESDNKLAQLARDYGWKLRAGQQPENTPVFFDGIWYLLNNSYGKTEAQTVKGKNEHRSSGTGFKP